jgi:hypothetical protein
VPALNLLQSARRAQYSGTAHNRVRRTLTSESFNQQVGFIIRQSSCFLHTQRVRSSAHASDHCDMHKPAACTCRGMGTPWPSKFWMRCDRGEFVTTPNSMCALLHHSAPFVLTRNATTFIILQRRWDSGTELLAHIRCIFKAFNLLFDYRTAQHRLDYNVPYIRHRSMHSSNCVVSDKRVYLLSNESHSKSCRTLLRMEPMESLLVYVCGRQSCTHTERAGM